MHLDKEVGSFRKIGMSAPDGAQVELYPYGAHVTSWRPAGGEERLFLSKRAVFRAGTAIRGGIPVCFPQFSSEGPLPIKHGFARLNTWKLVRTATTDTSAQAVLELRDSEATRKIWPHSFLATLTVTAGGPRLLLGFAVQNTGKTPFTFTGALHTYLLVDDVGAAVVEHLGGAHYKDAVTNTQDFVQTEQDLRFAGEVDRLYFQAPRRVVVREPERRTTVLSSGFTDVVVWNPGPEKCATLTDMEPDGYRRMVCVEAAVVSVPPEIQPGTTWLGTQELVAETTS